MTQIAAHALTLTASQLHSVHTHIVLTDACVRNLLPDTPLEEAGAAVAAEDAVVLPVGLVAAHLAQRGHGESATYKP